MTSYRHLQRAYENRPTHLGAILDEGPEDFCKSADDFVGVAYEIGVLGLEKVGDAARITKLYDRLAEVHFAICAARCGARVELLADAAFGHEYYAPDLKVELPGSFVALVEVIRFSDGRLDLMGGVRNALRRAQLLFAVDCRIGREFSRHTAGYQPRQQGDRLVDHVSKVVVAELRARPATTSGIFYVSRRLDALCVDFVEGPINEDEAGQRLLSCVATVLVDREGISAQSTQLARSDVEGFSASLEFKLRTKTEKRDRLPSWASSQPFVVAIRCDSSQPSPDVVAAVVDAAYREDAWTRALDGVLASHSSLPRGGTSLQWLPNPSRGDTFISPV